MYRKLGDILYIVQQLRELCTAFVVHFFYFVHFSFSDEMYKNFAWFLYNVQEYQQKPCVFCTMYSFFRTFLRMYRICFIRNVQKLCTDISVQCTRNEQKLCFFCTMYKNSSEYLYISLVHFVILEILVHFYPISIGLKQTTFWYFSRTRPSPAITLVICDENYWGVQIRQCEAAMNHWGWRGRGPVF